MRIAYFALCTAGMTGFYLLFHWLYFGISTDFGWGFIIGGLLFGLLVLAGEHIERKERGDQ